MCEIALTQCLAHGKPTIDISSYIVPQETEVIFLNYIKFARSLPFIEEVLQSPYKDEETFQESHRQ